MVPVLYQYFTSRTMEEEMKLYMQEQVNLVKANRSLLLYFIITLSFSAFIKAQSEILHTAGNTQWQLTSSVLCYILLSCYYNMSSPFFQKVN